MKNLFLFLFIVLTALSFSACKKNTDAAPSIVTSSMSYKVDGILKQAKNTVALGTFEFSAVDTSGLVIKVITDGPFDCEIKSTN